MNSGRQKLFNKNNSTDSLEGIPEKKLPKIKLSKAIIDKPFRPMNKYDTEPSQGSTVNMTRVIGIYEENDQN